MRAEAQDWKQKYERLLAECSHFQQDIEKIEVVNLKNEVISKIDTKNDQFKLKGDDLKSGLNVLRVYYKDGSVKTSKIYKQK